MALQNHWYKFTHNWSVGAKHWVVPGATHRSGSRCCLCFRPGFTGTATFLLGNILGHGDKCIYLVGRYMLRVHIYKYIHESVGLGLLSPWVPSQGSI